MMVVQSGRAKGLVPCSHRGIASRLASLQHRVSFGVDNRYEPFVMLHSPSNLMHESAEGGKK